MRKVIIVDDEPWILSGLKKMINFQACGFEPITASSGYEALEYLQKDPLGVDLVITDINMPGMNGLELIKNIKEIRSDIEIVILSGYCEFEYARQGMRLGANDYVLKPVNIAEMEALLCRINNKLDVFEVIAVPDFPEGSQYFALIGAGEALRNLARYAVYEYGNETACLIAVNNEEEMLHILNNIPKGVLVGASSLTDKPDMHNALIREARLAFLSPFIYGEQKVYVYRPTNFETAKSITKSLINTYSQNYQNIFALLESMPEETIKNELTIEDLTHIWNGIAAFFIGKETLSSGFNYYSADDLADEFKTQTAMFSYISEASKDTPEIFDDDKLGKSFANMLVYITNNYNKELYLKDLAQEFYLNMTYCCDLFRKHLNMTFHEYLTQIRMKKAKELLLSGEYTVTQISGMVGYIDNYYFSRVFKKYFGVAPKKFKESK
jgi:two-component system response regulator YesN